MGTVFVNPGLNIFGFSNHTDQIGINAVPTTDITAPTLLVNASPQHMAGVRCSITINETDRAYDGVTEIQGRRAGFFTCDVENNDPSWTPTTPIGFAIICQTNSGLTKTSYGTAISINNVLQIHDHVPSPHLNEYSCLYQVLIAAHDHASTFGGGNYWFEDMACHGPMGQPGVLVGRSFVMTNHYNGSPTSGAAAAIALQAAGGIGGGHEFLDNAGTPNTTYPVDIGLFIGGFSSGGTGDGFVNGIQIGGTCCVWNSVYTDQGSVARGVIVKALNAGTSVARGGAFVSEGTGEGGGLVFGQDTGDSNRVSISRPINGVMTLRGKVSFANGGYAASTTATPANVVGKIAIYNDAGTHLGDMPIYGSL